MPFETAEAGLTETDLTALLGSRLCHDLISPIGAIGNGVELLSMSQETPGPELELIAQSVAAANARVKFFRVAFGQAAPGQMMGRAETGRLLVEASALGRLDFVWDLTEDQPRALVKLAFLAMLCLETALPFGGTITVRSSAELWEITAHSEKARGDAALFAALGGAPFEITPARIQFALLPREARRQSRSLDWELDAQGAVIRF